MIEPVINEIDTYVIYYGILDGDIEGRPPSHPDFDKSHKSCLHIIAKSNNKVHVGWNDTDAAKYITII